MFYRRLRRVIAIAFPVVLFGWAIYQLFMLRFNQGDIYPAYSSLRADPLGTRILYESLERLPSLTVERNYTLLERQPMEGRKVLFYAGASLKEESFLKRYEEGLEKFVRQGGRLVLTFAPTMYVPGVMKAGESSGFRERLRNLGGEQRAELRRLMEKIGRDRVFGVGFEFAELPYLGKLDRPEGSDTRPVSWHSTLYFSSFDDETWTPLLRRDVDEVVMLERRWGAGSVVLASDSYFLSNEAMIAERHGALITYLLGDYREVVFDESHHAIVRNRGIISLARTYRLHAAIGCLLLLAGLFVWKNTVSLVPPHPSTLPQGNVVESTKPASEGFLILLRRNIAPRNLLPLCFSEWERACLKTHRDGQRRHEKLKQLLAQGASRPVETYRKMVETLHAKDS